MKENEKHDNDKAGYFYPAKNAGIAFRTPHHAILAFLGNIYCKSPKIDCRAISDALRGIFII